jgi:hypothetical protein
MIDPWRCALCPFVWIFFSPPAKLCPRADRVCRVARESTLTGAPAAGSGGCQAAITERSATGASALHEAAGGGSAEAVRLLCQAAAGAGRPRAARGGGGGGGGGGSAGGGGGGGGGGPEAADGLLWARDARERLALHWAAERGHDAAAAALLDFAAAMEGRRQLEGGVAWALCHAADAQRVTALHLARCGVRCVLLGGRFD